MIVRAPHVVPWLPRRPTSRATSDPIDNQICSKLNEGRQMEKLPSSYTFRATVVRRIWRCGGTLRAEFQCFILIICFFLSFAVTAELFMDTDWLVAWCGVHTHMLTRGGFAWSPERSRDRRRGKRGRPKQLTTSLHICGGRVGSKKK